MEEHSGHLVYVVNMDFTRKARWVKDGHKFPNPTPRSYDGVVSRESIQISLTFADMAKLDVQSADIKTPTSKPQALRRITLCVVLNSE